MNDHTMIDAETLDTRPGGVVLSVGMVRFNPTEGRVQTYEELVKDSFSVNIDLKLSLQDGFTISADTLVWWMGQSKEAQKAAFETDGIHPIEGAIAVDQYFSRGPKGSKLWANGANFDPGMLEAYFNKYNVGIPWRYNKVRCMRTISVMNATSPAHPVPDVKLAHEPVSDCIYQIQKLQSIAIQNPTLIWD